MKKNNNVWKEKYVKGRYVRRGRGDSLFLRGKFYLGNIDFFFFIVILVFFLLLVGAIYSKLK